MNTTLVPIELYYPKVKPIKKYRKSRTPIPDKIGKVVTSPLELMELTYNKRSVVIHNRLLLPAVSLIMWQFCIVLRLLNDGSIKEYKQIV